MNVTVYNWEEQVSVKDQFESDGLFDNYSVKHDGMEEFLCFRKDGRLVKQIPIDKIGHLKVYMTEPRGGA